MAKIRHVAMMVKDAALLRDFYRDGFGFVFTTTRPVQENRTDAHYHIFPTQRKPRA